MTKIFLEKKIILPTDINKEKIIKAYKIMLTSRFLDKKMLNLLKQGKSFFHIGCMGHEAIQVAAAFSLNKKNDWLFPYYRDQAFCLALGETPLDLMLLFLSKQADPNSGGRQMPMHYGYIKSNIITSSSSTGTQYLQAVGNSFASMRNKLNNNKFEVTVVCSGDGATSQGDLHEALSWSSRVKAPIIFLIQNNKYAISVPISEQRPGADVASLGKGYKNLKTFKVDGCNFLESFKALNLAVNLARSGKGPILIDADVVRLLPHSSSDDQKKYRQEIDIENDKKRDPIKQMQDLIIKLGLINNKEINILQKQVQNYIEEQYIKAEKFKNPNSTEAIKYVFSANKEPEYILPNIDKTNKPVLFVKAINKALASELSKKNKTIIFGQDVADNKGGVFGVTKGLTLKFGKDRCYNSPLAEASIIGVAIGLSIRGYKPIVEIQFGDYIWEAMMQIRNELTTIRYRSNNIFSAPIVIRVPIGGYIHGGLCHSQNIESIFAHIPGIKIALPSTAIDAYGLLKSAINCNDPVLFLEHKALYRQAYAKSYLPNDPNWMLPFGKGTIRRKGKDLTIITYGMLVYKAIDAANKVENTNIDVEIIDLRTINPYDFNIIEKSVKKTSRVLILHEDSKFMGFGAECSAEISDKLYNYLDAPVKRLAGLNTPIPYNSILENEVLPQVNNIIDSINELFYY